MKEPVDAANTVIVKVEPMGRLVKGRLGETLMALANRENLPVRSDCGGNGACGKCRVLVDPPDNVSVPTDLERDFLDHAQLKENVRLACQTHIKGPLTVTIPEAFMDDRSAHGKALADVAYNSDPLVRRVFLPRAALPAADPQVPDIATWFSARLRDAAGVVSPGRRVDAIRQLSAPSAVAHNITVTLHRQFGVTAIVEGHHPRSLGLAVDVGTTSIAAYLCDIAAGRVVATAAAANPQRRFGEDVISRIAYTNKDAGNTAVLQQLVTGAVSDLARQCTQQASARPDQIDEVTIVANTTMEQIFYGAHPYCLGVAPYLPLSRQPVRTSASDLGLALNPGTPVYVFPVVSGFVGGDTLGAVLADRPYLRDEMTLIVDIGTNGELVMGNREGLWAASCATGPAFEGAQISAGMRAVSGAISKVDILPDTGQVSYACIGDDSNVRPMGLCGSAVIDTVAALRKARIISESGGFNRGMPGVVYDAKGIGREFVLVPGAESATGVPITFTLNDIRQLQLGKAALAVGIECLTHYAGRKADRVILTGAFGAKFDWRNAVTIGMLPQCAAGCELLPKDNLAGVGAIMALLDAGAREEIEEVYPKIRNVDLAYEPDFQNRLMKNMMFPPL